MKKLFAFIALGLMMISSCTESDIPSSAEEENGLNYLVMLYGVGGGNLDRNIIANIAQAIDEGGSDKVAMTFEYKASTLIQYDDFHPNFEGTRRFTLEDNEHLKGMFRSLSKDYPNLDRLSFEYYLDSIKSEKIGDRNYDMSNADSLAAFIKWSKAKYPNAKRTVLVITDHGSGWRLTDGMAQWKKNLTRSMLSDDNLDGKSLYAVDVAEGISKGGGVDMLYTDACLMSMYENIYTYATAVRYMLTAVEITPEEGGDYRKLLNLLKTAGTSDAELEDAMHQYINYCVSEEWWNKTLFDGSLPNYDLGLYDLSKLDAVTPVLKRIASTLTEKFLSTESIEPTAKGLPLSDNFAPYIRKAVTQCMIAYRVDYFNLRNLPKALIPYMTEDIPIIVDPDDGEKCFESSKVINWIKYAPTDNAKYAYENYYKEWKDLSSYLTYLTYVTYPLTDLLRQINLELSAVGAQNNPFAQLHDDLMSVIKSAAHIGCTKPVDLPGIDQPYEFCSPGIFIIPFNETFYSDYNPYNPMVNDYEKALMLYQVTEFDKAVEWSSFLKVLDVTPSILHNPGRQDIKQ